MKRNSVEELVQGITSGDKRLLGKAITLVESKNRLHREAAEQVLEKIMPFTGRSVRVGVTGVPGGGKSTFIENFGKLLIEKGKKVAVLAIDPSSTINKGSILGDKTRMEELAREENAFIRPSPSGGFLGGVANATFEAMLICEAAGFDYILVETVGVGQSEVLVSQITDVFLYLKITGGGDELQGIKRGIMEMADLIFINKVDAGNLTVAKKTKLELLRALHFLQPKEKDWHVPVLLGSALQGSGLQEVYAAVEKFVALRKQHETFEKVRENQAISRFEYWVREFILERSRQHQSPDDCYITHQQNAATLRANPSSEAKKFVDQLFPE